MSAPMGVSSARWAERIVAQRASLLVASRRPRKHVGPVGAADRAYGAGAARMCRRVCGPAGQSIGSKPPTKKTRWPCRGRRPRVNKTLHRCLCYRYVAPLGLWGRWRGDALLPICRPAGALKTLARRCLATDMSPLRGFEDAGAAMSCYRYVAPLDLVRPVWAKRIVAQRAKILVARPDHENTMAL
jgi:hypothetical protein